VPNNAVLKHRIISEYHDSKLAAHRGRDATLDLVTRRYWWPSVAKDVSDYVASCPACQHSKQRTGPTPGLLQSLPIPTEPWESVTCDFITGLPRTRKHNDAICVFVDRLTKMVHCIPCRTDITAESTAQLFLQHIVRLHGEPKHIITDRGSTFMASFFQAYTRMLGTKSLLSTAYRPQTDGQTERVNRVLEEILRVFVSPTPDDWDTLLPMAEFAINNARHTSTGFSPFFLNYGRHPRTPFDNRFPSVQSVPAAEARHAVLHEALTRARVAINEAQQRQQHAYNRGKKPASYTVGDLVLLSSKHLYRGPKTKLMPRWLGPFTVDHVVGPNAVRLTLPSDWRVHPTFHVSLLKPFVAGDRPMPHVPRATGVDSAGFPTFIAERLVAHRDVPLDSPYNLRTRRKPRGMRREYLVRWQGLSAADDSWELASKLDRKLISEYENTEPTDMAT
jgi:transposase InsO family protein